MIPHSVFTLRHKRNEIRDTIAAYEEMTGHIIVYGRYYKALRLSSSPTMRA
jgi:hypothetical protein